MQKTVSSMLIVNGHFGRLTIVVPWIFFVCNSLGMNEKLVGEN